MNTISQRLRDAASGTIEWRVQDPETRAYCISFTEWNGGERSARQWLDEEIRACPESIFAKYEVARVVALDRRDRLLLEAADRLDEQETAVGQAVAFAQYVEDHAKGGMVEAARKFLSLPFSQEISARFKRVAELQQELADTQRVLSAYKQALKETDDHDAGITINGSYGDVSTWVEARVNALMLENIRDEPIFGAAIDAALVRELDVALNGAEGAAPQASLCDIVSQVSAAARGGGPVLKRVAELEAERADDDALRERMSDILKRTAIALRGPEPPLTAWSWHDLPERAAAAIASIDLFQRVAHNLADPRGLVPMLVDRFLAWKLPDDFSPDGGIEFIPPQPSYGLALHWPTGTCLLNAPQATAMFEHLLGIDPPAKDGA